MSQRARILKWLEERGSDGVHSFELIEAHMPRGAAVICALKKEGYAIESERQPFHGEANGVRYFLLSAELFPAADREPELVAAGTGLSPYDPDSEWV